MTTNIFSKVLHDGTLLETTYNPVEQETWLAVCKNGEAELKEQYNADKGVEYTPIPVSNDLLNKSFVRVASAITAYNGGDYGLFQEIHDYIAKYMKLPADFLTVSTVYVMLSWLHDSFNTLPYLRVVGTYGTGKSRFLQIMASLCHKSMLAGGSITSAGVFRTTDIVQGTLVFDEADFKASEMWSEIIKILNSGHTKGTPVIRMESNKADGSFKTKTFNVYGPKVLASRERFSDQALESRCLTAQLLPLKNLDKPIHLDQEFETKGEELRNKLLAFRFYNFHKIKTDENTLEGLSFPRLKQSALALTSVASILGHDVLKTVLRFLQEYENDLSINQRNDIKADILECIFELVKIDHISLVEGQRSRHGIYMQEICDKFTTKYYSEYTDIPDRSSGNGVISYRSGAVSARKIGTYIDKLGIRKAHDSKGFYIPIPQELKTIEALANRYGLETRWGESGQENKISPPPIKDKDTINADDIPF